MTSVWAGDMFTRKRQQPINQGRISLMAISDRYNSYETVFLTLSYSSKGSPSLTVFRHRHHKLKIVLPELPLVSPYVDLAQRQVHLLPLGPSCPLQTILQSDLVGCDIPLQIVMVVWRAFLKFKASLLHVATKVCYRLTHLTQQVQILKKCAKWPW
jgi:hypothetical protein